MHKDIITDARVSSGAPGETGTQLVSSRLIPGRCASVPPDPGFDVDDILTLTQHYDVHSNNSLKICSINDDPDNPPNLPSTSAFDYDYAKNLTDDGDKKYVYHAWSRVIEVWQNIDPGDDEPIVVSHAWRRLADPHQTLPRSPRRGSR